MIFKIKSTKNIPSIKEITNWINKIDYNNLDKLEKIINKQIKLLNFLKPEKYKVIPCGKCNPTTRERCTESYIVNWISPCSDIDRILKLYKKEIEQQINIIDNEYKEEEHQFFEKRRNVIHNLRKIHKKALSVHLMKKIYNVMPFEYNQIEGGKKNYELWWEGHKCSHIQYLLEDKYFKKLRDIIKMKYKLKTQKIVDKYVNKHNCKSENP